MSSERSKTSPDVSRLRFQPNQKYHLFEYSPISTNDTRSNYQNVLYYDRTSASSASRHLPHVSYHYYRLHSLQDFNSSSFVASIHTPDSSDGTRDFDLQCIAADFYLTVYNDLTITSTSPSTPGTHASTPRNNGLSQK